ncbi:MAG: M15 family metallopeptidase [Lachnospiraceae bacterium]|nr:M15 family metallopeptidase [Lachnospiraceae bacterium]
MTYKDNGKERTGKLIILTIAAAAAVILAVRPDIRYLAVDAMTHIGVKGELTAEPRTPELEAGLREYSLEELRQDPAVTVDQSLLLINLENRLSEDFAADVAVYKDSDVQMNRCMHDAYADLSAAVKEKFGESLFVMSAYRTEEEQEKEIEENGDLAAEEGASEHQAGLALDVYIRFYAGSGFLKTDVGQWVNSNCWKYGFIIRYPYYGEKETGIPYEPWHLRYVGAPHAEIIHKNRLTLESYMEMLEIGNFYRYGEFLITRQEEEPLILPEAFSSVVLSPDNQGGWIAAVEMESDSR